MCLTFHLTFYNNPPFCHIHLINCSTFLNSQLSPFGPEAGLPLFNANCIHFSRTSWHHFSSKGTFQILLTLKSINFSPFPLQNNIFSTWTTVLSNLSHIQLFMHAAIAQVRLRTLREQGQCLSYLYLIHNTTCNVLHGIRCNSDW